MKVLEIGGLSAGYFGRLFAQQEATVVRIDQQRPPPAWASGKSVDAFLHANKTCVAAASPAELSTLADDADIVVCETETADELVQLGFDAWATKIKVAITPFGRTGPKRNWQATPATLLAMGGYTHLIGDPDRMPLTTLRTAPYLAITKQGKVGTEPIVHQAHTPGVDCENNMVVLVPDAKALTKSAILL